MKTQLIGRALRDGCPYRVELCPDNFAAPIRISYGIGMGAIEADCPLANLLTPGWTEILQLCNCEWLLDLAREERERGALFTPDEIRARVPG